MDNGVPQGAHIALNAIQFPVVAQTYFGVAQQCLEGVAGHANLQKSRRRGKQQRAKICDAYRENLVKATLPEGGMVVPPQRYFPSASQNLSAIRHVERF
jgi:hypothetical protein